MLGIYRRKKFFLRLKEMRRNPTTTVAKTSPRRRNLGNRQVLLQEETHFEPSSIIRNVAAPRETHSLGLPSVPS